MLTEMLAMEWATDGIRANSVCPGFVHTSMTEAIYRQSKLARGRARLVPLGRVAKPGDIADAIAFLLARRRATSPARRWWSMAASCARSSITCRASPPRPGKAKRK